MRYYSLNDPAYGLIYRFEKTLFFIYIWELIWRSESQKSRSARQKIWPISPAIVRYNFCWNVFDCMKWMSRKIIPLVYMFTEFRCGNKFTSFIYENYRDGFRIASSANVYSEFASRMPREILALFIFQMPPMLNCSNLATENCTLYKNRPEIRGSSIYSFTCRRTFTRMAKKKGEPTTREPLLKTWNYLHMRIQHFMTKNNNEFEFRTDYFWQQVCWSSIIVL